MRVAVNARLERGRAGGVQRGVEALATALAVTDRADQAVTFVTWRGLDGWLTPLLDETGLAVHPVLRDAGRAAAAAARDRSLLRPAVRTAAAARSWLARPPATSRAWHDLGADVVHFPYQEAEVTDRPSIYQPWDLQHRWLPHLFTRAERRRREVLYRRHCEAAAVVVVATAWIRDDVCAAFDLDRERVVVIPPWAPPPAHPVQEAAADRSALEQLGVGGPYAVYPAQAWPHKNHGTLIDALALLRADGIEVPLVLPGATNHAAGELRERADAEGVGDLVHLPGYLDDDALDALLRRARCLVFPSLFEGWGYPVLEAFHAGVPVACSDLPSLAEAAGGAAATFDPHDAGDLARAVAAVWADDDLRRDLVDRGRRRVSALSWRATGDAYRTVYRAAAEGRPAVLAGSPA